MTQKPKPLSTIQVNGPIPADQARSIIEESLREAILDGRLPCGTALRQQELADLFGVSRMPVREALRQLEAQSLLNVVQHKGAVVAPLITNNAVETYALRSVLESFALRLSIPLLDDNDLALAAQYIEQLETETDHAQIGKLNRLFHMSLYHKAPNSKLLDLIERELNEEERFLRFHLSSMGLGKLSQDDHRALLDAARAKDIDNAVVLLERHLEKASVTMRRYLEQSSNL
ncbi:MULTISPECIES: GntR family transcriptional regulator [Pseudomonas]|uniref:Putative transcription factor, GntR family n=1 Tax=Pseudomonas brassicacearum (strain NFM421) TaxID=994484 RepID=F2KD72_PSEBN|nr:MULTISPECIES: GntR family transcriptional regulator [Pseudomonas]EIK70098.1 transcriptional regulator, GntR family [Pseudomonas fluorescens Q8r1-96]KIR15003.1 HTH-type transcriptional regulator McbR [Pseudomonas fluorescens]AEA66334.1 Putative transcription factor, GntR family [Pseudomonas brassicacearum subsp. brassicacearum NFM421]ALQ00767.1 putative regulator PutR for proline utilization, GntR family [Pseudomonas brassicacearum]AOS40068.1 GntR family transcriptional regulator [Pseudomona